MAEQVTYRRSEGGLWWCNSHKREATYIRAMLDDREVHCCDPGLGGILLPCRCVDLTDVAEIEAA